MPSRKRAALLAMSFSVAVLISSAAYAHAQHTVELWKLSTPDPIAITDVYSGLLLSVEFIADPRFSILEPQLAFRNISTGAVLRRLSLQGWNSFNASHRQVACATAGNRFRIVDKGRLVLAVQCPWLTVFDSQNGSIVGRELPDSSLLDMTVPSRSSPYQKEPVVLAVNRATERIAVAYNIGAYPQIFMYSSDLKRKLYVWPRKRYIQDLSWSRDGKYLAVLYSGLYDEDRNWVGWGPERKMLTIPNLEVIDSDPGSREIGALVATVFSGDAHEGQLAFSPDAAFLYTITAWPLSDAQPEQGSIRVVDWKTAKIVRSLEHRGLPFWGAFAISPDGRWIAADASAPLPHFFLSEPDPFGDRSRFVVLDSSTGETIFQASKRTIVSRHGSLTFADDADILFAVLGPGRSHRERTDQKDELLAYCIAAPCPIH